MPVQQLEAMLDVNPFLQQLEQLLSSPIRIPNRSLGPASQGNPPPNTVFSVKGIWSTEQGKQFVTDLLPLNVHKRCRAQASVGQTV